MRWNGRAVLQAIDRRLTERVILFGGWLWFLVYAYPGYMSYDSTWQLAQARHLEPVNEWHPPMMAIVWRYLDHIWAGPFPMLVLQSLLFMFGMRALCRHVMSPRKAAIAAVLLLIIPQNIVVMAVIWKDSQMGAFLVAALACLFSRDRRWRIAGYVCIFFATAFRYNAAAATFPIVLWQFGYGGTWRGGRIAWRRVACAAGVWLAITVSAFVANGFFIEKHWHPWQVGSCPVDIAGIIRYSPHLDNDQLLRDTPDVPWHKTDKIQIRVRSWYRPENQFLNVTNEPGQIFDYPHEDRQVQALAAAWKKLVVAHPWAFIKHRFAQFGAQLECETGGAGGVFAEFTNPVYDEALQHRGSHSWAQQEWIDFVVWLDDTLVYRVSLYFLLCIVLLPFVHRRIGAPEPNDRRLLFVILASGICHELGLLLVAPAVDYRYSQWMIACAIVGTVIAVAGRLARRRS